MTAKDRELIELAHAATYQSTIKRLMAQAETKECRTRLERLLRDDETEWED